MAKIKRGESQQNEEIKKSEQEPMDISGTGSNPEESDFIAVPDDE